MMMRCIVKWGVRERTQARGGPGWAHSSCPSPSSVTLQLHFTPADDVTRPGSLLWLSMRKPRARGAVWEKFVRNSLSYCSSARLRVPTCTGISRPSAWTHTCTRLHTAHSCLWDTRLSAFWRNQCVLQKSHHNVKPQQHNSAVWTTTH